MKLKNVFGVLFLILGLSVFNVVSGSQCHHTSSHVFKSGEEVRYKVFYNLSAVWVAAGEAVFSTTSTTYNGTPVYHVIGRGNTYKSYEWVMKVRDRYESYIDQNTLTPLRFKREVNEDNVHFTNDVSFNHTAGKAYSNDKVFNIKDCTQDVLSTVYFARNLDYSQYKVGSKIPFSMFLDDELHDIYIRYLGKVRIKTKYGTFNAIKLKPLLIKGTIFKGGEQMTVYVSDDKNRIPIRIESPILVGKITVDLMGFKNLKYPLSSKIK